MQVEYDEEKDRTNREKHGLSLAAGETVFADARHLVISTFRPEDREHRYKAIGMVDGKLRTAVYVNRGEAVRFVSVRRSNDGEARAYSSRP